MRSFILSMGILPCALLIACKDHKPEPTCQETIKVFERNGQQVMQAMNGLYLLKDRFPGASCESKPYSDDPYKRHFVNGGGGHLYWRDHKLYDGREYYELFKAGKWPDGTVYAVIDVGIGFGDAELVKQAKSHPDWWYESAIPHERYPIDLLPNFGLEAPDPNVGSGPLKGRLAPYWAVRGSQVLRSGQPYVTRCGIRPPPNNPENDYRYQTDPKWLIRGETYTKENVGQTCRGNINADNGKPIGGRIDVPGMAVADIDKIYQAVSQYLSTLTVD